MEYQTLKEIAEERGVPYHSVYHAVIIQRTVPFLKKGVYLIHRTDAERLQLQQASHRVLRKPRKKRKLHPLRNRWLLWKSRGLLSDEWKDLKQFLADVEGYTGGQIRRIDTRKKYGKDNVRWG